MDTIFNKTTDTFAIIANLTPERVKSVKENEVKDGDVVSLKLVPKPQKKLIQV